MCTMGDRPALTVETTPWIRDSSGAFADGRVGPKCACRTASWSRQQVPRDRGAHLARCGPRSAADGAGVNPLGRLRGQFRSVAPTLTERDGRASGAMVWFGTAISALFNDTSSPWAAHWPRLR